MLKGNVCLICFAVWCADALSQTSDLCAFTALFSSGYHPLRRTEAILLSEQHANDVQVASSTRRLRRLTHYPHQEHRSRGDIRPDRQREHTLPEIKMVFNPPYYC